MRFSFMKTTTHSSSDTFVTQLIFISVINIEDGNEGDGDD